MNKIFCQHWGRYTLDRDNKCCKCGLPLNKGVKGIRLPLKPKQKMNIYEHIRNPKSFPNKKDAPSLYNVLFHYNHHRGVWACFSRDKKSHYFNGKTNIIGYGDSTEKAFKEYLKQNNNEH